MNVKSFKKAAVESAIAAFRKKVERPTETIVNADGQAALAALSIDPHLSFKDFNVNALLEVGATDLLKETAETIRIGALSAADNVSRAASYLAENEKALIVDFNSPDQANPTDNL